jgi:hypothetical protein
MKISYLEVVKRFRKTGNVNVQKCGYHVMFLTRDSMADVSTKLKASLQKYYGNFHNRLDGMCQTAVKELKHVYFQCACHASADATKLCKTN